MRQVSRIEDMSRRGRLTVFIDGDGDIVVAVQSEEDGLLQPAQAVEFCACVTGGGKSPETREALLNLMKAMERDNLETPSKEPKD